MKKLLFQLAKNIYCQLSLPMLHKNYAQKPNLHKRLIHALATTHAINVIIVNLKHSPIKNLYLVRNTGFFS